MNEILPPPDDYERGDRDEWKNLPRSTRHYHRRKESERRKCVERTKLGRDEKRRIFKLDKEEKGCRRCGYDDHGAALVYHHRHEEDKEYGISKMVQRNYGIEKIRKEIEKCDVMCSNCHNIYHYEQDRN